MPYHCGQCRDIAQDMGLPLFELSVLRNGYFNTCLYQQPGIGMLHEVLTSAKIVFASETVRAFRGVDPRTGQAFDDTRPCFDASRPGDSTSRIKYFLTARSVYMLEYLIALFAQESICSRSIDCSTLLMEQVS